MVTQRRRSTPLFLLLFALPFAGVGIFMGGLMVRTLLKAQAVERWMDLPATVLEVDLKKHHGSDSTTYQVTARYRYEVNGQSHESTRVGLQGGSDNIGSWQQDQYRRLAPMLLQPGAVRCRVNPADPDEAYLIPGLRWGMVFFHAGFALVFGGVGIGLIIGTLRSWRRQQRGGDAPDEAPWKRRGDWAQGLVKSANRREAWALTVMALFWNVISWSLVLAAGRDVFKHGPVAIFLVVFPAIGVGLIIWAVRQQIAAARYGDAVFQMASVPGVLGGRLAGVIRLPGSDRPANGFIVRVLCQRAVRQGKSTTMVTSWQQERVLDPDKLPLVDVGHALPVLFALPYDQPESGAWHGAGNVQWRLQVTGSLPGVDVAVNFEIPVFKTAESRPDFTLDEKSVAGFELKA